MPNRWRASPPCPASAVSGTVVVAATVAGDHEVQLVGLAADRTLDLVRVTSGRAAQGAAEVVASPGLGAR